MHHWSSQLNDDANQWNAYFEDKLFEFKNTVHEQKRFIEVLQERVKIQDEHIKALHELVSLQTKGKEGAKKKRRKRRKAKKSKNIGVKL